MSVKDTVGMFIGRFEKRFGVKIDEEEDRVLFHGRDLDLSDSHKLLVSYGVKRDSALEFLGRGRGGGKKAVVKKDIVKDDKADRAKKIERKVAIEEIREGGATFNAMENADTDAKSLKVKLGHLTTAMPGSLIRNELWKQELTVLFKCQEELWGNPKCALAD